MCWRSWTPASAGSAILGYDDLLIRLADALKADDSPAQIRMHRRWPIVMVDEFQDTDPVQWQVIDRAFSGRSTVILIGDPKQAIYAFRGGDIVTYLKAADTAGDKQTLGTNWRSDGALVDRLQVVLRGAELGDPRIVVHDVDAYHRGSRLVGCAELRSVPAAGGQAGDVRPQRDSESRHRRPAHPHSAGTSPRTSERCWPAMPPSTARSWWPAT